MNGMAVAVRWNNRLAGAGVPVSRINCVPQEKGRSCAAGKQR